MHDKTHFEQEENAMNDPKCADAVKRILLRDRRYDAKAYFFVDEAVLFTIEKANKSGKPAGMRHVNASELIKGAAVLAMTKYSFLAPQVFEYWGLESGADFGNIVFSLIDQGVLSASEDDRIEDFEAFPSLTQMLRDLSEKLKSGDALGI